LGSDDSLGTPTVYASAARGGQRITGGQVSAELLLHYVHQGPIVESLLSSELAIEAGSSCLVVAAGDPTSDDHPLELVMLQAGTSTTSATPVS
jgi:hypothetical protein